MKIELWEKPRILFNSTLNWIMSFFIKNIECFLFFLIVYYKCIKFNAEIMLNNNFYLQVSTLGAVLLLTGISLLFKRKIRISVLLVFDALISIIMISDMVYFRYYNDVISVPVLMQAGLVGSELKSSIMNLIRIKDLLFVVDLLVFLSFAVAAYKMRALKNVYSFRKRIISTAAVLLIGTSMTYYGFYQLDKMMGFESLSLVYDHGFIISNIGILDFHGFDAVYAISSKFFGKGKLTTAEKDNIKSSFDNKTQTNDAKKFNGVAKGMNLIAIQVESMQNMVINLKIDAREVTPNLNKLIKKSVYCDNYFSETSQGNSADAEFISNNSFFPLSEGAVYFKDVNNTFDSLPKELKQQGYTTMAMHAYRASYWNRATIYPAMGFDEFFSQKDYNMDDILGNWGLSDKSFLDQSLVKLQNAKQPFYSFLITLTSHYPFEAFAANGPYVDSFDAGQFNNTFFGAYLKAMHYADASLGSFLDGLEKNGMMDNSVIAIYGDHDAMKRTDIDGIRQYFKLPDNNDLALLQMRKVPLIIHIPGDKGAGLKTVTGGQVDLYPTLANLFGFEPQYCLGRDLINSDKGFALQRDGSVTDGKTVYLGNYDSCFDINTGEKVDKSTFTEYIEDAKKQLYISDAVIENNLLSVFEKQLKGDKG